MYVYMGVTDKRNESEHIAEKVPEAENLNCPFSTCNAIRGYTTNGFCNTDGRSIMRVTWHDIAYKGEFSIFKTVIE